MSESKVNLWDRIKAILYTISHWPLVEPILELLALQRVLVLVVGAIAFYLIPTIPDISPIWADRLGNLVFFGSLALFGGIQVDQWMETRKSLPGSLNDIGAELFDQFRSWLFSQMSPQGGPTVPPSSPLAEKPPATLRPVDEKKRGLG